MKKLIIVALLIISVILPFALTACKDDAEQTHYTLTFDANGGEATSSILVVGNEQVSLPVKPTRTGYSFVGWYYEKENQVTVFNELSLMNNPVSADLTVYAKWLVVASGEITPNKDKPEDTQKPAVTYTVTFATNGGEAVETQDTATVETRPSTQKGGYVFEGWYKSALFHGEEITFPYSPTEDVTLYAKWSDKMTFERVSEGEREYVYFGYYPQTVVDDVALLAELEQRTPDERGFVTNGGIAYKKTTRSPVYSTTTHFANGNVISESATYYFKSEPIKWRVLSDAKGKGYLVTDKLLDVSKFASASGVYADSLLRTYLQLENNMMTLTEENSTVLRTDNYDGVYSHFTVPSLSDMEKSDYFKDKTDRICYCTDYALSRGAAADANGAAEYWLRNDGTNSTAYVITKDGSLGTLRAVANTNIGVRFAVTVDYYYKVTFDGTDDTVILCNYLQRLSKYPTPQVEVGERFDGWFVKSDFSTGKIPESFAVTNDIVLYAKTSTAS